MALSERELTQLEAHAGKLGIPVVYVNHPEHDGQREPGTRGRVLELWQEGQDAGYSEVHPPAPFLDAWALHLAQDLLLGGLVPTIPVAEPGPEI